MQLSDFNIEIPPELIADYPLAERGGSRLLVVDPRQQSVADQRFAHMHQFLKAGDLLVLNNTRVMRARLVGQKLSGGKIELLVERLQAIDCAWCHVRASKTLKIGGQLILGGGVLARVMARDGDLSCVQLEQGEFATLMAEHGQVPLPPYIKRPSNELDSERYQTVYAQHVGAVAAPTAGLHFDREYLQRLQALGIDTTEITLHVGAGTFQPVRVQELHTHKMHQEWLDVPAATVAKIEACRQRGSSVVAVGTTVARALESAARTGRLQSYSGMTDLFILPGYEWRVVDSMLTNFHLSGSTLLMLVSAFAGRELVFQAYQHAISQGYRFFSYGDAMLILNRGR